MHAWYIRVVALVIIASLSIESRSSILAIALCLALSLGSLLLWINERRLRRGTVPRFWLSQVYLRNVIKTDGVHGLSLRVVRRNSRSLRVDRDSRMDRD